MRSRFEEQLTYLNDSLIEMGELVEQAIADANKALVEQDTELAKKAKSHENEINGMEREMEGLCLKLILQQQPVAGDLRLISSVLKIITDLERIGDHATDISTLTISLAKKQYVKKLDHIPLMAAATMKMVTESIDAFVKKDLELAQKVINDDDIVDNLFNTVRDDLIELLKSSTSNSDQVIDLIMVAKYFERIGDHATNIAEWVVFSLTGIHKDIKIMR